MTVITSTDADFQSLISEKEKVIVKFYASWSGSCRLLAPKYKRISNSDDFKNITF
ncbi:thioredoxin family protein [Microbulbifer taiwanensis]